MRQSPVFVLSLFLCACLRSFHQHCFPRPPPSVSNVLAHLPSPPLIPALLLLDLSASWTSPRLPLYSTKCMYVTISVPRLQLLLAKNDEGGVPVLGAGGRLSNADHATNHARAADAALERGKAPPEGEEEGRKQEVEERSEEVEEEDMNDLHGDLHPTVSIAIGSFPLV